MNRLDSLPTWLLSRASARGHRLLTDALAEADARGYHYRLLVALDELGPSSQADLGRHAQLDRSDVVASLEALEATGSVAREADPADGRRKIVTLTPAGRRRLKKLDAIVAGVQDELLAALSSAERAELVRLLGRLGERAD